jgi:hypothetical protein
MNNESPSITSIYFIDLIKAFLQGTKTRKEILEESAEVLQFDDYLLIEEGTDITHLLIEAARDLNETFYLDIVNNINQSADTAPTRAGLIHHLGAFLQREISRQDLLDWATWYSIDEDQLSAGMFDDFTVEFFCFDFLPKYFSELTNDHFRSILQLLQLKVNDPLKEKIAILLLLEKEKQSFLFFLRNYLQSQPSTDTLDLYLMKKFGMDHHSFPYMEELYAISGESEKLEELLDKITFGL